MNIEYYTHDEFISLPYIIMPVVHNQTSSFQMQTIIVIPDFNFSILFLLNLFVEISKFIKNARIVLFSLPGQFLTFYDEKRILNNVDIAMIVDGFIYDLLKKGKVDEKDVIKFIGIGYFSNFISER